MATARTDLYLGECTPRDPVTDADVTVRVTSAEKWNTEPGDSPASAIYWPGMQVTGFGSSIWSDENSIFGGFLDSKRGQIRIPLAQGRESDLRAPTATWKRYVWKGKTFTVYKISAGGNHASKVQKIKAQVSDVSVGQREVLLGLESFNAILDEKPIQPRRFWGRKHLLHFQSADAQDRVNCGDLVDLTGSFTLEALVRINSSLGDAVFIQKGDGNNGYELSTGPAFGTEGRVAVRNAGTSFAASGAAGTLVVGELCFLSGVFDSVADTLTLYKNGVQVAQVTSVNITAPNTAQVLMFGSNPSASGRWLNGDIAEIRIWNVARSHADIAAYLYGGFNGVPSGLIGWWKFGEGTGSTLADETSTNADGTITGATWDSTYEGEEDVAGREKPWLVGIRFSDEPVLIDSVKQIYASSSRGYKNAPIPFDGGVAYLADTSPSTSDLFGTSVASGKYKYDLGRGLFRLGTAPALRLSVQHHGADIEDSGEALQDTSLPAWMIYTAVHESAGFVDAQIDLDEGDFSGFASIVAGGIYIREGKVRCSEVVARALQTYRAQGGFKLDGIFRAEDLTRAKVPNTPDFTLTQDSVRDLVIAALIHPVKEVVVQYREYAPPHSPAEIAGSVTAAAKNDLIKAWREHRSTRANDRNGRAFSQYGDDARTITIQTAVSVHFGPPLVAAAILDALDTYIAIWRCQILDPTIRPDIGDTVLFTHPELGLGSGVECLVVGTSQSYRGSRDEFVVELADATTLAS